MSPYGLKSVSLKTLEALWHKGSSAPIAYIAFMLKANKALYLKESYPQARIRPT